MLQSDAKKHLNMSVKSPTEYFISKTLSPLIRGHLLGSSLELLLFNYNSTCIVKGLFQRASSCGEWYSEHHVSCIPLL